jgi:hypothetical protein
MCCMRMKLNIGMLKADCRSGQSAKSHRSADSLGQRDSSWELRWIRLVPQHHVDSVRFSQFNQTLKSGEFS